MSRRKNTAEIARLSQLSNFTSLSEHSRNLITQMFTREKSLRARLACQKFASRYLEFQPNKILDFFKYRITNTVLESSEVFVQSLDCSFLRFGSRIEERNGEDKKRWIWQIRLMRAPPLILQSPGTVSEKLNMQQFFQQIVQILIPRVISIQLESLTLMLTLN